MVKRYDVDGVRSPGGRYSLVAEVEAASQMYFLAGQTGMDVDGNIGAGLTEQAEICYARVARILSECEIITERVARRNTETLDNLPLGAILNRKMAMSN